MAAADGVPVFSSCWSPSSWTDRAGPLGGHPGADPRARRLEQHPRRGPGRLLPYGPLPTPAALHLRGVVEPLRVSVDDGEPVTVHAESP
ncbi:hypothetical protein AB0N62_18595 [Streptomyces sp. NPDC093982]|uniref:hypothetical protein n=1 Tax=Streptomyces sp. NPDC093982 TaxID=3155077 RepID=UPI0034302ABE